MPTQPGRSETDTTQPASPKAQPEPAKRKPGALKYASANAA